MDELPPTAHAVKPHHVSLLTVFLLVFKEFQVDGRILHPAFLLHVYRVLLKQIAEVSQPMAWEDFLRNLAFGPQADRHESKTFILALARVHTDLATPDQLTNFFGSLPSLFIEKQDEDGNTIPSVLGRRSIFGYFCRRCFVSFLKLSYSGVVKLHTEYIAWSNGKSMPRTKVIKGVLSTSDNLLFKTSADKHSWALPDSFEEFERGQATGDENVSSENLRRFFEQHFHEGTDSGYRQMALLNLARMHYIRHEYEAARKLLSEAVTISRTIGDKMTLQHCISMIRRLPPENPKERPLLNEIQSDINPLEILYDVRKLMKPEYEQPLSISWEKIAQAIGLYDHWVDVQLSSGAEMDQWGQHAVQSIVWKEAGCDRLAAIEENIVVAFTEWAGDDQSALVVTVNRAYKKARDGDYDDAMADLFNPSVWRGISTDDYVIWATEVWNVLMLRATRRGQMRLCKEFLLPRRPCGEFDPKAYFCGTTSSVKMLIRDQLHKTIDMRQCDQATTVIKELLEAAWHSEFQGRLTLYRISMVLLVDLGLEYGMTNWCLKIMEDILPQIAGSDERELRALGCFTYARCLLAHAKPENVDHTAVLRYLQRAENDYRSMEMLEQMMQVQYFLAVVLDSMGRHNDRDLVSLRYADTEAKKLNVESSLSCMAMRKIWELVVNIGAALAAR